MAVFTHRRVSEVRGRKGADRIKEGVERGNMSGDSDEREDAADPHHHLANHNNHNHTTNHLRQYFFPCEPIPRLSISDPLASQLIAEEVSDYRCNCWGLIFRDMLEKRTVQLCKRPVCVSYSISV